jgi:hypothetical protein
MHANLPHTPVSFISAARYFQMLPGPPGALKVLPDSARVFSGASEITCGKLGAIFSKQWF